MPRARCLFRGTEITRAVKAAKKAGQKVARVEIDQTGKIILVVDNDDATDIAPANEWDEAAE